MAFLDYAGLARFKSKLDTIFNGIKSRVDTLEDNEILYTESYTEGNVAAKTAIISGFTLKTGRYVAVKFANTNTAENPTLNISSTGAKPIYNAGQAMPPNMLTEDNIYIFRYNGTEYDVMSASGSGGSGAFIDVPFEILSSAWTLSNNVYVAEVSNNLVTETAGIQASYDESIRTSIIGDIFCEKTVGKIVFKTYRQPVGTLSGYVRIFDGIRQIVNGVAPIEVGGTGGATAAAARTNLHVPAVESITDAYNSSSIYAAGARVIYNNKIYRCTTAISTPEQWNEDHWVETTVDKELALLASSVESVETDLSKTVKSVNNVLPNAQGEVDINHVTYADNLVADDAQSSSGQFIERTTGGSASLSDGDAWLSKIRGSMVHTGYVPQNVNMTVELGPREESEEPITVTINDDAFIAAVSGASGTKVFTYTTAWSEEPSNFGITVVHDPVSGDKITVVYQKEDRGTITFATPTAFKSTNWNLYNHTLGYARVLKYSDTHGFLVGGTYTTLEFSSTIDGEKEVITPVDGFFDVSEDGYIWVTGGNSTDTYILMTWSDWTNGYTGSFQTYSESTISLAAIMEDFPDGLMQVGAVRDEIDLNVSVATSYIEKLVYNSTNLAYAKSSGRSYEYDTNYIYLVREEPATYSFTLDGSYSAYDHGVEFVTGTTLPVYAEMLYGQNLKDKLRIDVVTKSQDLVNNLTTNDSTKALTAAQGKEIGDCLFPVYNGTRIEAAVDFNNLLTTGIYSFPISTVVALCQNKPTDTAGKLIVYDATGAYQLTSLPWAYRIQEFYTIDGLHFIRRISTSGSGVLTFTGWSEFSLSSTAVFTPNIPRITYSELQNNVAVKSGNIVMCRCVFKVDTSQDANTYIDGSSLPSWSMTRRIGHGVWHDENADMGGVIHSSSNGNLWLMSGASHYSLKNNIGHYIYISYSYVIGT